MYQGTNKTALQSQALISDALVRLMGDKAYNAISISALCKEAGVSRQTFYSLFNGKDEVIIFELGHHAFNPDEACHCKAATLSLAAICDGYSRYIIDTLPFLTLLAENDMVHFIQRHLYQCLSECPSALASKNLPNRDFVIAFVAGGLTSVVQTYVNSTDRPGQENLTEIIYNLFSGKSFQPR